MKLTLRQFDRPAKLRGAFTLTELLVAMGIFVILATLTVGAFRTNNQDRVGNAAGNFKNALEGARSRAINSGEVRGLRLLLDTNPDPDGRRICRSVIYVGAPDFDRGDNGAVMSISDNSFVFRANDSDVNNLSTRGLLKTGQGLRLEFPENSGNWRTITGFNTSNRNVTLAGTYHTSASTPITGISYRMELMPVPLEGAEPMILDNQVCIDLDGSDVPGAWRPPTSGDDYSNSMDILFGPNGTITGPLATEGLLHFRIAYLSDFELARNLGARPLSGASSSPVVPADPEKDHKALSIFTTTGSVVISEIDRSDDDGDQTYNEIAATEPFKFAIAGKESR